jgi:hypothetical protein
VAEPEADLVAKLAAALEQALREAARTSADPAGFLRTVGPELAHTLTSEHLVGYRHIEQLRVRAVVAAALASVMATLLAEFHD